MLERGCHTALGLGRCGEARSGLPRSAPSQEATDTETTPTPSTPSSTSPSQPDPLPWWKIGLGIVGGLVLLVFLALLAFLAFLAEAFDDLDQYGGIECGRVSARRSWSSPVTLGKPGAPTWSPPRSRVERCTHRRHAAYGDGVTRRKTPGPAPGEGARRTKPAAGSDEYIVYGDPDSGMQQFEDDRDWHHDQRRAEGYDACPECGTRLGSSD